MWERAEDVLSKDIIFIIFFSTLGGQNGPQVSNFSKKIFDSPSTLLLPLMNGVEQKKFRENIPTNKEVIGKKRFSPSPQYTRRPFNNAIEGSERERVLTHSVSVSLSLSLSLSPLSYCETQRKVAFRPVVQSVYKHTRRRVLMALCNTVATVSTPSQNFYPYKNFWNVFSV